MHEFDDIRPYYDREVSGIVHTLLEDLDLSRAMGKFSFPRLYRWFPGPVARLVQAQLRQQLRNAICIRDVQKVIERYLDELIETTTDGLTFDGLDRLDPAVPYLFISNHRDITMDPALVNYMLYHQGFDTLQIAIGDNLLKRPFLSRLMKLNKSFVVKRGLQGRDKLAASKQLSGYISHCIRSGQNVWIAQREGRAKDGVDQTESAILKMLHMAGRDGTTKLSLADSLNALHVVPVAISYEYDPCDVAKATELHAKATLGKFVKDDNSDVQSILSGMIGWKGAVHVSFGTPLQLPAEATAEQAVAAIDRQILTSYRLHPSNLLAYQQQEQSAANQDQSCGLDAAQWQAKAAEFEQRLQSVAADLRPYLLRMYANPVISSQQARSGP